LHARIAQNIERAFFYKEPFAFQSRKCVWIFSGERDGLLVPARMSGIEKQKHGLSAHG
jgi:hypothetical protein